MRPHCCREQTGQHPNVILEKLNQSSHLSPVVDKEYIGIPFFIVCNKRSMLRGVTPGKIKVQPRSSGSPRCSHRILISGQKTMTWRPQIRKLWTYLSQFGNLRPRHNNCTETNVWHAWFMVNTNAITPLNIIFFWERPSPGISYDARETIWKKRKFIVNVFQLVRETLTIKL